MAIDSHHAPARRRRLSRPDDALLTEVEAADLLRMSERTLQAWRGQGRGPAFVRAGRAIRYRRSDLAIWIEAHVVPLDKVSPPPPSHAASSQQFPAGTP
jgi:predicted DNA-binding transcriptional regulator AlpA